MPGENKKADHKGHKTHNQNTYTQTQTALDEDPPLGYTSSTIIYLIIITTPTVFICFKSLTYSNLRKTELVWIVAIASVYRRNLYSSSAVLRCGFFFPLPLISGMSGLPTFGAENRWSTLENRKNLLRYAARHFVYGGSVCVSRLEMLNCIPAKEIKS